MFEWCSPPHPSPRAAWLTYGCSSVVGFNVLASRKCVLRLKKEQGLLLGLNAEDLSLTQDRTTQHETNCQPSTT